MESQSMADFEPNSAAAHCLYGALAEHAMQFGEENAEALGRHQGGNDEPY